MMQLNIFAIAKIYFDFIIYHTLQSVKWTVFYPSRAATFVFNVSTSVDNSWTALIKGPINSSYLSE